MHLPIDEKTFELHGWLTEKYLPVDQVTQVEEMYDHRIFESAWMSSRKTRRAVIESLESILRWGSAANVSPIIVLGEPIQDYIGLFVAYLDKSNNESITNISNKKIVEELSNLKKEWFYLTYNGNTRLHTNKKLWIPKIPALIVRSEEELSCIPQEEQVPLYHDRWYLLTFFELLESTLVRRIRNNAIERFPKFTRK